MKRIFSLILCCVLTVGMFAACGEDPAPVPGTDSATPSTQESQKPAPDASTDSSTDSENSDASSEKEEDKVQLFDPNLDHKVIMDDSATKILIADLNLCGEDPKDIKMEDCIVWEWDTNEATGAKICGQKVTMDEAGLRYSAYWKRDVVIFCGSGGWVGVVDYATKEVLFEDNPGNGPHSVEMLPNGDLVLACSGNGNGMGTVLYYPLSEGKTKPANSINLESAHGVCYDPTNEMIWVLGGYEIIGCVIRNGKLTKLNGTGASLKDIGHGGGHDFVPVFGDPGKYWVSGSKTIMLFDANEQTITDSFPRSSSYTGTNVKGIAWFEDGTMIISAHDQGGTGTYRSSEFRFLYLGYTEGKIKQVAVKEIVIPHRPGSQTYKIHALSKNYQ